MAFTNTPEISTQHLKIIPIIGGETVASNVGFGTAQSASPTYQGQRYINCYPKRLELVNTDDKWVLTKCPPIVAEQKIFSGSGSDQITTVSSDGRYIWKGSRLYLNDTVPTLVYTGTNLNVKTMFQVVNPSSANLLYAGILKDTVAGTVHSYTFDTTSSTFTKSSAITFAETSNNDPWQSAFFNGRLYIIGNDKRIYNTPAGQYLTWNSTDFIVPEAKADELVAILLYKNYLVAFSTQSIEFYQDGALELGSPLVRQEAYLQLYGVRYPINIVQTGDNIFFLSYEDRFGYGVYTIDNFSVKRISNFYVDTILNHEDITADKPFSTRLSIVDFYGDPCLLFNCGFGTNAYFETGYIDPNYIFDTTSATGFPYVGYSTKQRQWFDFAFSSGSGYNWTLVPKDPGFMQLSPNSVAGQWKTYFIDSYGTSGEVNFYYFTKDYNSSFQSISEVVFDSRNFGVNNWKHIRYVDAVGDFGDNTVSLSWTDKTNYSNWSSYVDKVQSSLGYQNAIRWHNLGRHRTTAFRVKFTGASNVMLEQLEVAYNLGTR